ncbi:MAG: LCP family protein, partial [Acidimicrobiales bacterium]
MLIGANILVALCIVVTAGGYGYFKFQVGRIPRVTFGQGVLRNDGTDDPGQPMNVLVVGSDSREGLEGEEQEFGDDGQVGGKRSDTMIVLRVDPQAEKAVMLSIPRDLFIPIAGENRSDRVNSAFNGGPERLVATIRQSLGIEIDHYVEVNFNGFRGMVEAVGGVAVHFPSPSRDDMSGLWVESPGCNTLDGDSALSYVRSRHFEAFEAGRWRADPTGDLGRINRQQDFVRRALSKAMSKARTNPLALNALINTGVANVTLDSTFSTTDMVRLARRFRSLEPDTVEMMTIPADNARIAGKAVLVMRQPDAQVLIDRFNGVVPPPPEPLPDIPTSSIRVRVLNGSGVGGQAVEAASDLKDFGFNFAGAGDAASFGLTKSVVRYGSGQLEKARVLQAMVRGGASLQE